MSLHQVRVRFAPSPTGFLHIGGARTALFNWLYARAQGGKFLLRIEDTDPGRSEARYTEDILASLRWLGLDWDEEPVFQSSRFESYREKARSLLDRGLAYRCECTPEQLDSLRAQCEREKRPFRYPGTCREKKVPGEKFVVRVRVPTTGETAFNDLIRGEIRIKNQDLDDWVILRGDGSPTYNFCVVIDDSAQAITHVLRGDDHINNTPKQILLYEALQLTPPDFAHLPMILGADRSKLSKRHGAGSTLEYRKMGYLPEALVNFLVRLGWSHGDQEIFTIEDLKKNFSLEKIGRANAIFSTEKLDWVSGHYLRAKEPEALGAYMKQYFRDDLAFLGDTPEASLVRGIAIVQGKVKSILELIEQLKCLFGEDPRHDVTALKTEERSQFVSLLAVAKPILEASDFSAVALEPPIRAAAETLGVKFGAFAGAIRYGVTGGKVSPGLFEMLEAQGKERVLRRIESALAALKEPSR